MTGSVGRLADFAVKTQLGDIPTDVLDYSKLVFLDSVVSGIAAARLDRGLMVQRLARRFGGPAESTVFGLDRKVAAVNAVHANCDMMNLLDADDTFFNSAHFAVFGAAAGLAESERLGGTGADLLRAHIAAFEINARLNLSTSLMEYDGDQFNWSALSSHGYAGLGAAAACGVVGKFDSSMMANAIGLVTWLAPPAKNTNLTQRVKFNSFKYGPYGAIGQAGILAAGLAEEGFVGDADMLDLEPGFIRGQGYIGQDRSELTAGLGTKWWILDTSVKPYPTCRFTHASIDAVLEFGRTSGIDVSEIESIEVRMSPAAYRSRMFNDPAPAIADDHRAPLQGAFNIPYAMAVALLGHTPGPKWYSAERLADPAVWELARRIRTAPDPVLDREWQQDLRDHPGGQIRKTRGSLTIRARGTDYLMESDFCQGDPWDTTTRADWDFMERKVAGFCEGLLDNRSQRELLSIVRRLDEVENVADELSPLLQVTG